MTKTQWLEELVTVDQDGYPPHDSNKLNTKMPREKVFKLRQYNQQTIDGMWRIYLDYVHDPLNTPLGIDFKQKEYK